MPGDAPAQGLTDFAQGVVEVVGPDLERSLAFYQRLGFTLVRRTGGFAVVQWRGQRLFLAENTDAPTSARWSSLRLLVDDVDALHAAFVAAGIRVVHGLGDRAYGLREFAVRDPNGFDLRFVQPLPP
ncbi:MAG: VOC family protein [Pseudoxanthomonas sp.]